MIYFIVNKHSRSGKGAEIWKEIENRLKERQITYKAFATEYAGHARLLAIEITQRKDEEIKLFVLGGDGTVNEAINGIVNFEKVKLGIIPTGSGNDLARGLGITKSPVEQLDALLDSEEEVLHDLGRVTWNQGADTRLFAISSGIGMDAIVCKKALTSKLKKVLNKLHLGKLTYILITIHTLFSMRTADATGEADGKALFFSKLIFTAAMNFKAEGGGVPMAPRASATDGKLSVCSVHGIPKALTFFALPFLVAAKHEKLKGFEIVDCDRFQLNLSEPFVLHTDGEYCADVTDPVFCCEPAKIRIIV